MGYGTRSRWPDEHRHGVSREANLMDFVEYALVDPRREAAWRAAVKAARMVLVRYQIGRDIQWRLGGNEGAPPELESESETIRAIRDALALADAAGEGK